MAKKDEHSQRFKEIATTLVIVVHSQVGINTFLQWIVDIDLGRKGSKYQSKLLIFFEVGFDAAYIDECKGIAKQISPRYTFEFVENVPHAEISKMDALINESFERVRSWWFMGAIAERSWKNSRAELMAIAYCSECCTHFEPPFDDKKLAIWLEVCQENGEWLCLECAGLELLASVYISIEVSDVP